jgi:hypothetical protein
VQAGWQLVSCYAGQQRKLADEPASAGTATLCSELNILPLTPCALEALYLPVKFYVL